MTFEIEINGRGRTVSIERAGPSRYRVTVDGVAAVVDAERIGDAGVSMLFPDAAHEGVTIQFAPGQRGTAEGRLGSASSTPALTTSRSEVSRLSRT